MKATRIKMKQGCNNSEDLTEINEIYLEGLSRPGYYPKSSIYDYLKNNPNANIYVDIQPYPDLQPVISINGEKYVRSEPDYTGRDNLLNLPRD